MSVPCRILPKSPTLIIKPQKSWSFECSGTKWAYKHGKTGSGSWRLPGLKKAELRVRSGIGCWVSIFGFGTAYGFPGSGSWGVLGVSNTGAVVFGSSELLGFLFAFVALKPFMPSIFLTKL